LFPELNHNCTVGFEFPPEVAKLVRVVMLRSPLFNARVKLRYEVTAELLDRAGVPHEYVDGEGQSPLAQMVSLVSIGDYASYYLAILNRTDPSPVKVIDYLKGRLAEGK
jgi:glucose/mannose-6-phosphate isomerase